jgi:hypothetical protein
MRLWMLSLTIALLACQATPPANWAQGGAPLVLPDAQWTRSDGDNWTISATGEVRRDGRLLFVLDRAGRVFEEDNEAVALLESDGRVTGTDEEPLGRVGLRNASPPWSRVAWLRVAADGTLMLFDPDGEPLYAGRWRGCTRATVRACTLVSHLIWLDAVRRYARDTSFHPRPFGVGVGVWY